MYAQEQPQWVVTIAPPDGGSSSSIGLDTGRHALVVSSDGAAYVVGTIARSGLSQDRDAVVAKISPTGELLWQHIYDGEAQNADVGVAIALKPDQSPVATFASTGVATGFDFVITNLDPSTGDPIWTYRYDGPAEGSPSAQYDYPTWIDADQTDGAVVVMGQSATPTRSRDTGAVKVTSGGALLWSGYARRSPQSFPADAAIGSDGSVVVVGSESTASTSQDAFVVRFAADTGVTLWSRGLNNSPVNGDDGARSVEISSVGTVVAAGSMEGASGVPIGSVWGIGLADGADRWLVTVPGASFRDLILSQAGDATAVGGPPFGIATAVRVSIPTGVLQWRSDFAWPAGVNSSVNALALDSSGNVLVAGAVTTAGPARMRVTRFSASDGSAGQHPFEYAAAPSRLDGLAVRSRSDGSTVVAGNQYAGTSTRMVVLSAGADVWDRVLSSGFE